MRLTDFDVMTFDLIGTLIDFETGVLNFLRPRILPVKPDATDDELLVAYAEAQSEIRKNDPHLRFTGRLPITWDKVAARFGVKVQEGDGLRFIQSARNWPFFDDAPAALAELRKYFRGLVVVTNGDRISARVMAASLGSPFTEIITEEDMGFAKPDPRAFEYFIDHLGKQGFKKERILHVAQSQYHDIGASKAAGLATAWIYRRHGKTGYGGTQVPPQYTKPDFLALSIGDLLRQYKAELLVP